MGTSSITITSLTATPSLRGNKLAAVISATGPAANLSNLMIDVVEFYASTTNDFATASVVVSGYPEAIHAGLIEEQTYYYWARAKANNGSYGAVFPVSPTGGVACTAIGMSGLAFGVANGKLVATVAANALTIALKTIANSDPSVSDPVYLAFPGTTAGAGSYTIRAVTAALSITVPNGASLGVDNNAEPFRIWVALFDDEGTLRLAVKNCSDGTGGVFPLPESALGSSVAIATTSDNFDTFYSDVAVTSKPFRVLGRVDFASGLAVVTQWSEVPDPVRLEGRGGMKPGDVLQNYASNYTAVDVSISGTHYNIVPYDNTKPQITEGRLLNTLSLTPSSSINIYELEFMLNIAHSAPTEMVLALFKDGAADAIATASVYLPTANKLFQVRIVFRVQALTALNRSYELRYGSSQAGTMTLNGVSGAGLFNGTLVTSLAAREIAG